MIDIEHPKLMCKKDKNKRSARGQTENLDKKDTVYKAAVYNSSTSKGIIQSSGNKQWAKKQELNALEIVSYLIQKKN